MTARREQGKVPFRNVVWLLILVFLGYILYQVAPAMIDNYDLENTMREQARFAEVNKRDVEEIREAVWTKIRELKIPASPPIQREHIEVEWVGRNITITVKYKIDVNLIVYKYRLEFSPSADNL